jgi:hypothetical protein
MFMIESSSVDGHQVIHLSPQVAVSGDGIVIPACPIAAYVEPIVASALCVFALKAIEKRAPAPFLSGLAGLIVAVAPPCTGKRATDAQSFVADLL